LLITITDGDPMPGMICAAALGDGTATPAGTDLSGRVDLLLPGVDHGDWDLQVRADDGTDAQSFNFVVVALPTALDEVAPPPATEVALTLDWREPVAVAVT
jgi:hypothetical protein